MINYKVKKLDGSFEQLDLTKAEDSLSWALSCSKNISAQDIMIASKLHIFNGIETSFIHDIFIKTTYELADVSKKGQEYWTACRNLMIQKLYKQVFKSIEPVSLKEIINKNVKNKFYTERLLNYSTKDFILLENTIKHNRDFDFTASGIEAMLSQYGIHSNNTPIETPQVIFMTIAMDISSLIYNYSIDKVIELYDDLSTFKITLPTPAMLALRTGSLDLASCETLRVGDTIRSWTSTDTAIVEDTVGSKGIGIHIADIASVGDKVKNGKIIHSGKIPVLKSYEGLINKSSQNNRRGSLTAYVNFLDPEIIDILSLKSVKTSLDKRINSISYGICLHQLVYDRALRGEDITLISNRDVDTESISDEMTKDNFEEIYIEWEKQLPNNIKIPATLFFEQLAGERSDNSAYYIFNIDEANKHTMYNEPIVQANICCEFCTPTLPLDRTKPNEPAVGICVLGNINQGKVDEDELPRVTRLFVETLTKLSLLQTHATPQANAFVKHYRDIGVGFSNHAYWLAKQDFRYGQEKALKAHHNWMETFAYGLLSASCELAKDIGKAPGYNEKSTLDFINSLDKTNNIKWGLLINNILEYGLANCGLSMLPPSESSSIPSNQTSSMEPIRDLVTMKDKAGITIKQFAPDCLKLADKYDYAYDRLITKDYLKHVAITQMFMDKATSTNTFYNQELFNNKEIPISEVIDDIFYAKKLKIKSLYYHNNKVQGNEQEKLGCKDGSCDV